MPSLWRFGKRIVRSRIGTEIVPFNFPFAVLGTGWDASDGFVKKFKLSNPFYEGLSGESFVMRHAKWFPRVFHASRTSARVRLLTDGFTVHLTRLHRIIKLSYLPPTQFNSDSRITCGSKSQKGQFLADNGSEDFFFLQTEISEFNVVVSFIFSFVFVRQVVWF